ncbi:hypothetical protein KAR91_84665 [Candidatus Pacearchaeota archaeon]|nr:hypothetical protein [Candidatus Pacearchaeota archaeon]
MTIEHHSTKYEIIDTNVQDAVSPPEDVSSYSRISAYIEPVSGTHANHIVQVEVSADPTAGDNPGSVTWMGPAPYVMNGAPGCVTVNENVEFVRCRVSTVEGSASTCRVKFIAGL